jgi:transposase InsO family protein
MAVVMDLYSRKVIGVAVADHMQTELCVTALTQGLVVRQPAAGWVYHNDQGSQYTGKQYQALLSQHQGRCSMSRKGNCWDNAVVESFFHFAACCGGKLQEVILPPATMF